MNLDFESFVNSALAFSILDVFKVLFVFALFLYILFAFVVVKQVYMMTRTIGGQLEIPLKMIAILHLLGAVLVFLLAFILL